jgi:Fe2+ transport system protein FeoA
MRLAFSSDGVRPLSALVAGERGLVVDVRSHDASRVERLFALGVTPGAAIDVLQTFPAVVFRCDQTELAVERGVADVILVRMES